MHYLQNVRCSEVLCITIPPFFSPASSGLHHVHWLQHFLPLLDWSYYILLVLEVGTYDSCHFCACSVSQVLFCSYRKELIQKVHNFVHLNLCIALALGLFLFLTGVQTATANVVNGLMNIHTYIHTYIHVFVLCNISLA